MKQSKASQPLPSGKAQRKFTIVRSKKAQQLLEQPLLQAHPQAVLPLIELMTSARLGIEQIVGAASRQFIEQLLIASAQDVAGVQHPGIHTGDIRWHGQQNTTIALGSAKLRVRKPRLRGCTGEIGIPAHMALRGDAALAQRIADILVCGVSTRKYARAVHASARLVGVSKSAVSRQFVKASAQQLAQLNERSFKEMDLLAIYVDGIIIAGSHILAAVGVDSQGKKHVLGLSSGSSENARVVKDLLTHLSDHGVDMNVPRLWIIDGSKALASAIEALCGQDARIQRCRIHKVRNVADRIKGNKTLAAQVKWQMQAAFKLDEAKARDKLKSIAKQLRSQYPDAAASCLEGLDQMFTVNALGVQGQLLKTLSSTHVIESPNSVVRTVSGRVKRYKDADMALRWAAAGFLEAESKFRRVRGYAQLKQLKAALRPSNNASSLKMAA
jgi:transposase-like protein